MLGKKSTTIILTIVIILIVLFNINYKVFFIKGQSMEPTLKSKQFILVSKRDRELRKNDIIIFNTEEHGVCVKRIIAMNGDVVELYNGYVTVNGIKTSVPVDVTKHEKYVLKEQDFFVIGDNNNASIDSRHFGVVNKEAVIGKVILS